MFALAPVAAVAAVPAAATVLATTAGVDPGVLDLVTTFSSFGVLGIGSWMFATGRLYSKSAFDEIRRDRDQARGEVQAMTTKMLEDVVPALRDSTVAVNLLSARRRGDG